MREAPVWSDDDMALLVGCAHVAAMRHKMSPEDIYERYRALGGTRSLHALRRKAFRMSQEMRPEREREGLKRIANAAAVLLQRQYTITTKPKKPKPVVNEIGLASFDRIDGTPTPPPHKQPPKTSHTIAEENRKNTAEVMRLINEIGRMVRNKEAQNQANETHEAVKALVIEVRKLVASTSELAATMKRLIDMQQPPISIPSVWEVPGTAGTPNPPTFTVTMENRNGDFKVKP